MSTEEHQAWQSATLVAVDNTKDKAEKVRKAVAKLEQDEAEKNAAEIAERERQAKKAAAADARRKAEAERLKEEAFRAQQAADMKAQRQLVAAAKAAESADVKAATANFHREAQLEKEARDKAKGMSDMAHAKKTLLSGVHACQRECRMTFGVIKVCEMRRQMRQERPPSERFKDYVDDALEKELGVLSKSRDELTSLANDGSKVVAEMQATGALLITGPSRENVAKRMQKSSSLPALVSPPQSPMSAMNSTLGTSGPSTASLLKRAWKLADHALELAKLCQEAVESAKEQGGVVTQDSNTCLEARKGETMQLIKSLEFQKEEVQATISDAERRLTMLKMRAARGTPTAEETAQLQDVTALVSELKEDKHQLEEDWRNKTASYKVDDSLRLLTRVRAGGHVSHSPPSTPS